MQAPGRATRRAPAPRPRLPPSSRRARTSATSSYRTGATSPTAPRTSTSATRSSRCATSPMAPPRRSPRALAIRPRGQRPRGARRAPHPARRRLREGPSLPGHLHRRGRARAGPLHGGAAGRRCPGSSMAAPPRRQSGAGRAPLGYAYGRSQTGRLARARFVYEDLNLDEAGPRGARRHLRQRRRAGCGASSTSASGRTPKDRNHMMAHLFPFTDLPTTDPVRRG